MLNYVSSKHNKKKKKNHVFQHEGILYEPMRKNLPPCGCKQTSLNQSEHTLAGLSVLSSVYYGV